MKYSKKYRNLARGLCAAMCACAVVSPLAACGPKDEDQNKGDHYYNESTPLVLATDVLDGVFNPFFYTSGSDGDVVSQTQIGMLSSDKNTGRPIANWDEPCVAFDYSTVTTGTRQDINGDDYTNYYTDYYFALKDNIKFSDGVPLTKEDVLFNIYMYLDPSYTGSSTMYSVNIRGLNNYRSQTLDDKSKDDDYFNSLMEERINYIYDWLDNDETGDWGDWGPYEAYPEDFIDAPAGKKHTIELDILQAHELFREEVETDWNNAMRADVEKDYEKYVDQNGNKLFTENWQVFMYNYGFITLTYVKAMGAQAAYYEYHDLYEQSDHSQNTLINTVYNSMVGGYSNATKTYKANLANIISYYATASTFRDYVRSSVISHETKTEDGNLLVSSVSGITMERMNAIPTADGTRKLTDANGDQQTYDVLHIQIDGVDPKAIQNFSFTVAPGHYYSKTWNRVNVDPDFSAGEDYYFGVEYSDPNFMREIKENQLPLGAGPYKAATDSGETATSKSQFFKDNIVYMARNDNFLLGAPKIRLLRYKVVSGSMLYNAVKTGEVHYSSPSMDYETVQKLEGSEDKATLDYSYADNLGYGYIGVSARYVQNIYVRRAIMTTLDPSLCVAYYGGEQYASVITRPMSRTLTEYYPEGAESKYPYDRSGDSARRLLREGGCQAIGGVMCDEKGQPLKYTFTIAGDSDDHPAANMLLESARILNNIGFEITVSHDSTALTKLSSGLLTVWAAAWSSSSDPDMYQVYHKNSKATSTLAWGYTHLNSNQSTTLERTLLNRLADYIEEGREYTDVANRKSIYTQALNTLMDLAVEFPTYQRKVYYVWRKGVFDNNTIFRQNNKTYQSPLSEIWNVSYENGDAD